VQILFWPVRAEYELQGDRQLPRTVVQILNLESILPFKKMVSVYLQTNVLKMTSHTELGMVNSQTFKSNIFVLEEGVVEWRVQSRKKPIFAAIRIKDCTRALGLPAEQLNYMTAYSSRVN
jgi:hypothetical protein